jgi:hypothetical protein
MTNVPMTSRQQQRQGRNLPLNQPLPLLACPLPAKNNLDLTSQIQFPLTIPTLINTSPQPLHLSIHPPNQHPNTSHARIHIHRQLMMLSRRLFRPVDPFLDLG